MDWEAIPDFGIYSEQLLSIINKEIYNHDDPLSSSMVNNYVKKKYIEKPVKRKYYRDQVAALILISLFKGVLNMDDLSYALNILIDKYGLEDTYKRFKAAFKGEESEDKLIENMVEMIKAKNKIEEIIFEERSDTNEVIQ